MIYIYFTIFLITCYFVSGLFLYLLQDKILYIPGHEIFKTPIDEGMEYKDIDLYTEDGLYLNSWFIKKLKGDKTVLFCHGNSGSLSHRVETVRILYDMGFSVFIFDYRGYGISEGSPSEKGTYLDAECALSYLIEEEKIPESQIIVWGRSMGGPIAAKIAKEHNLGACVLESTFTSIPEIAKERFKIFPSCLLARYSYPTIDYVKNIDMPVLIVHSKDDEIIPYRMGEKIFKNVSEPKMFLKLKGDHNNTYFDCIDKYKNGVGEFFKQNRI